MDNSTVGGQLENPHCELSRRNGNCSSERSQRIIEQEVPGIRKEINKGVTYRYRGDDERRVVISALYDHVAFVGVLSKGFPRGGVCINGMSVYTTKHNPSKAGHTKTDAYSDGRRRLDARFLAK